MWHLKRRHLTVSSYSVLKEFGFLMLRVKIFLLVFSNVPKTDIKKTNVLKFQPITIGLLHVTFSEKGTKMTPQLHISKFEIFSFSIKIHKTSDFLSLLGCGPIFLNRKNNEIFCFYGFYLKEIRISNIERWSWGIIFVPFSEKVTCTKTWKSTTISLFSKSS